MHKTRTVDAAIGKWPVILTRLGVEERFLRNAHGPCPLCGGRDRYRFDDKGGKGTYYCNSCGPGDGMDLAIKFTGREFREVAKEIDGMVGNIEVCVPEQKTPIFTQKMRGRLEPWRNSQDVIDYLKFRGVSPTSKLMCVRGLEYFHDNEMTGKYDAMVMPFLLPSGHISTYHVTYLDGGRKAEVPRPKKIMKKLRPMEGGAIRLTDIFPHIGIAEGIETALSIMLITRMPCWAAASAGAMAKFQPPEGVESVTVFADNDSKKEYTGQVSAYTLAASLKKKGYAADVIVPTYYGDFADEQNAEELRGGLLERGR